MKSGESIRSVVAEVRSAPAIDPGSVKVAVVDGVKMPVVTISAKRAH
jgi:hypothetical protein